MLTASATKKTLFSALLVTLGLVLGYVENMFLPIIPLYGLKIGFSNIVVICAVYQSGFKNALAIGVLKAFLSGVFFSGLMSIAYGVTGILFSVFAMNLIKNKSSFSEVGVSVLGSGMFQIGQVLVACAVLNSAAPLYYLSYLLIGSVPCGIVSGLLVHILRKRFKIFKGVK